MSRVSRLLLALSSAGLLILSFPNFNQPYCAWVALVPWLVGLRRMTPRPAFGWSWLTGFLFFLASLWWMVHLTAFGGPAAILGWLALSAYLALYFGAFGWFAHQVFTHHASRITHRLLVIPSVWVALEYLRSHLLSGFGWNLLGYSQAPALSVIQLVDLTGVWGVSFLLVMVNAAVADYVGSRASRERFAAVLVAAGVVAAGWEYGQWRLRQPTPGASVTVAVVQGNIPQEEKWDEAFQAAIVERYERLTRQAALQQPDLIVWPETAVPGSLGFDEAVTSRITELARTVRIPLLVGAPMGVFKDNRWFLTNSAALIDPAGQLVKRYDKLHLVPFGEFVPFESVAPWLRNLLPPVGDFIPGHDFTVFQSLNHSSTQAPPFSVLICFEDVFPSLARRFVRQGATFLLTITNDAWFGPTAAAYQHAQASTFRAVELGVPMVRAANTGWSGGIDARGRWIASVKNQDGRELFTDGIALCEVAVGGPATLYQRWGDWFAWLCGLGCVGWVIFAIMKR